MKSSGFETAILENVTLKTEQWSPQEHPDAEFKYIDINSIDRLTKTIVDAKQLSGSQAPSRARLIVNESDVIVSTVRPNLNAVALITKDLDKATASTGFCVLRPDNRRLDSRYLYHFVRHPAFISRLIERATGASYPAVTDKIILESKIPLPPLQVQKKIAAILEKADQARRKRQETLRLTDQFLQSAFLQMFGDPVINSKKYKKVKLSDLGTLERGRSKHRPRNAPELLGGKYPLVQTGDIANCYRYIKSFNQTYSEFGLGQSRMWPKGTLCITIAANIAKTGILAFDACFPDSVVGFTPNEKSKVEYVQYCLSFFQKILEDNAPESAQKNINLEILRKMEVPIPSLTEQKTFVLLIEKVEAFREKQRQSEQELEILFQSLMQKAFTGELAY